MQGEVALGLSFHMASINFSKWEVVDIDIVVVVDDIVDEEVDNKAVIDVAEAEHDIEEVDTVTEVI